MEVSYLDAGVVLEVKVHVRSLRTSGWPFCFPETVRTILLRYSSDCTNVNLLGAVRDDYLKII